MNTCRSKRGFTLIELLIVAAIIGILATLGVGFYNSHLEDAKMAVRANNLKLVNDSIANFYKTHNMLYPKYDELDTDLSIYMNQPASQILKEACNTDDMQVVYSIVLPAKKGDPINDDRNAETLMNAAQIAADTSHRGQHRVKNVSIRPIAP